ncbi:hypothetical protein EYF80_023114 [Liparis tanakae]|uniref:Uncharacterized protein n=1 Tax=Liparis tanakae TaxID=230148 RepID=A0A4Z2HN54_9TELE|nr:hypothetical protein EYF80_023114 [Liparis tanakae]
MENRLVAERGRDGGRQKERGMKRKFTFSGTRGEATGVGMVWLTPRNPTLSERPQGVRGVHRTPESADWSGGGAQGRRSPGPTSRMSRRRSTGDLVPSDITEILAREARAHRGPKKPGSSLGQAFSWLKGNRRKKNLNNGLNRIAVGVTDAKLGLQNHDSAKARVQGLSHEEKNTSDVSET